MLLNQDLCSGCGACYILCPYNAIRMVIDGGAYKATVVDFRCRHCGLCEKVCPSYTMNDRISLDNFGIGHFIRCYIGYSTDESIRWSSSSGGLVTTILCSLLNKGLISGAIVVRDNPKYPLSSEVVIARDVKDVKSAMGSRYRPVKPSFKIKDLLDLKGKMAVVGLPCHIWGFRKIEEMSKELKRKILMHLGLFCGKCPNFYATIYFIRKVAGLSEEYVVKMSYRGEGWPGRITIETNDNHVSTFEYKDWVNFSYFPNFIPVRCMLCYDLTNQLADISLGDAWGLAKDEVGVSVAISRTRIGEEVLQQLNNDGEIFLHEVSPEHISKGQGLEHKIRRSLLRCFIWQRIFKQPTPTLPHSIEKISMMEWHLNLAYCTLSYVSRKSFARMMLNELSPLMSKLKKMTRMK